MRILKRTSRAPLVDEYLSYFTIAEARELRRLVEASFARAGHDVTVHVDHVENRRGTTFGLWNIAAFCRGADRSQWADLVDEHVQRVTTPPRGLGALSPEELEAALYLRLVDAGSVPDADLLGYARQVAPGLLEVLAVDLPDSVVSLRRDDLAELGTLRELLDRGRESLRATLADDGVAARTVTEAGSPFTVVTSPSFFTASLALILPDAIERFTDEVDRGDGVLVAVPDRHQLLYRVIDDPSAAGALDDMFELARWAFDRSSGPLSPNVYWVRALRWAQVTSVDEGKPRIWLRGELESVIEQSA
jgi:hypothetical protein